MVKQAQKNNAKAAAEAAKQQAEAQRSAEESARNAQINAEMWTNNDKYHTTQLPYTTDYIRSYVITNANKSQEKILASFDNERNYVQQWLNKNNLTLKQLRDMNYTTVNLEENSKKYGKQMYQANIYYQLIEQGELPQNCSTGDWIRYVLKKGKMQGWNWLALWGDPDFSPVTDGNLNHWMTIKDIYEINVEVYNMIEKDLPTIANYKLLSKENRISQIESLSNEMITPIATTDWMKKRYSQYQSRTDLLNKLRNKWNTEYLPNIKE